MKNTSKYIVGFWHYGVILTYLSMVSAVVGICMSALGKPFWGAFCLLLSGFCDAFDGVVAKTRKNRTDEDKSFGGQIDSLSDIVAFGVAPVMIGFGMGMKKWYFIVIYCFFSLCALIRLAYYNVTEEVRVRDAENGSAPRKSFEGLPVTNAALVVPVCYLMATMFFDSSSSKHLPVIAECIMALCYLTVAILFIARFKMPKLGVKGVVVTIIVLLILLTALFCVRYFVFNIHHF